MNEIFSFSRFRRLFVKLTAEHYRTYLMSIAVLTGVLLLGGSFVFYMIPDPPDPGLQAAIFIMLGLLAGTFFTSTVFSDYGEKTKAIPALILPATALEKFLVGWLYSYPIFLVVYTGVFYIALYGLSHFRHWGGNQHFYPLSLRQNGMDVVLVMYSILHALSLFGAIFFRKLHFIKSAFAFFISLAVIILLNTLLLKIMTGLEFLRLAIPFGALEFSLPHRYYSIYINNSDTTKMIVDLLILVTVLVWVASYFRLKEKQV
jgi:hypothetical protein